MSAPIVLLGVTAAILVTRLVRVIGRERLIRRAVLGGPVGSDDARGQMPSPRLIRSALRGRAAPVIAVSAVIGGVGWAVVGPVGLLAGIGVSFPLARSISRRRERRATEALERQLGEVSETVGLALRSGLSVGQALEFAATEASPPMAIVLGRFIDERRVGITFDRALRSLAADLGTEDARLFALVVGAHARTGGDLAGALDAVTEAIRHRTAVRTELRALSTQGRVSGAIMGSLPIVFCLVLATTSRRQLVPVFRSPAGILMLSAGLALEALAYVWIRRLLRVEE